MNRSRLKFVSKQANHPEDLFRGQTLTKLRFWGICFRSKWIAEKTGLIIGKVNKDLILFHKCISCHHKLIQHSLIQKIRLMSLMNSNINLQLLAFFLIMLIN